MISERLRTELAELLRIEDMIAKESSAGGVGGAFILLMYQAQKVARAYRRELVAGEGSGRV